MGFLKEEIHYCTTCGAVNKKSAVLCEECKKKIILRHRPLADFLKKRVKSKTVGDAAEGFFKLFCIPIFTGLF